MRVARIVRAAFLSIKTREYIEAAHCIGVPPLRMILQHMLPNAASGIIVSASLTVAGVIIAESTLSFLGLGFPPDYPTWGRLLYDAKDLLAIAPHVVLIPGAMIFLTVLSINFIGDGLRDALDPRKSS
jgi:peptide/nickel transport system permease protein